MSKPGASWAANLYLGQSVVVEPAGVVDVGQGEVAAHAVGVDL